MRDVAPPPGHELHGQRSRKSVFRALGLGVVTGACDDDPVAIGTYASAGASFGASFLWTAPATFPMMYAVVYLSSKLGQVTGKGLFHVIKDHFSRWLLWPILVGVLIGNTIEAGADLGGMAAAINLFVPLPIPLLVVGIGSIILALQIFGSYELIRNVFRWFALALLAYVGSAILAKPDAMEMLSGTFIPRIQFTAEFLAILVAVMGTTLSACPYTWQSNVEVEEEILKGRTRLEDKRRRIAKVQSGYCPGYAFRTSSCIPSFSRQRPPCTSPDRRTSRRSLMRRRRCGRWRVTPPGVLFALGVIGVGFLAVPIMTTGAAYDLCQVMGWKSSLHARPKQARHFYVATAVFTAIAIGLNFLGFDPMKALV